MEKLAIFDVDFTITRKETMAQFYLFMLKKNFKNIIYIFRIAFAGILYLIKIIDLEKAKQYFMSFITGISENNMKEIVRQFYEDRLSKIFYNDAIEMIKKLKNEGYKIILISASPEFYLNELYNIKEIDKIIGTKYYCIDGIYEAKIEGKNCKGEEKVKRLYEYMNENNITADFDKSYMFSDSLSDLPLFNLVGNKYLINYRRKLKKNIEVLYWR